MEVVKNWYGDTYTEADAEYLFAQLKSQSSSKGSATDPPSRKAGSIPKGMSEKESLQDIVVIDGKKYYKNTSNIFAEAGNSINNFFGGSDDYFVEHKEYDKADESFINEAFDQSAGRLAGGVVGKAIGKGIGALVGKKGGLSIADGVLEKLTEHAFAKGRHADLGLPTETMASNIMALVTKNLSKLSPGNNTMHVTINGIQKTIMTNVANGTVRSVNMYPGVSNRVTQGTVRNLGNVKW